MGKAPPPTESNLPEIWTGHSLAGPDQDILGRPPGVCCPQLRGHAPSNWGPPTATDRRHVPACLLLSRSALSVLVACGAWPRAGRCARGVAPPSPPMALCLGRTAAHHTPVLRWILPAVSAPARTSPLGKGAPPRGFARPRSPCSWRRGDLSTVRPRRRQRPTVVVRPLQRCSDTASAVVRPAPRQARRLVQRQPLPTHPGTLLGFAALDAAAAAPPHPPVLTVSDKDNGTKYSSRPSCRESVSSPCACSSSARPITLRTQRHRRAQQPYPVEHWFHKGADHQLPRRRLPYGKSRSQKPAYSYRELCRFPKVWDAPQGPSGDPSIPEKTGIRETMTGV